ncbi:MAG TPA: tetratricopeptide repeat protein [Candidatus Udaeobacter sp.]|nr:tetratricopeptide repeat protein [Candidatus Udaeobacter sp.]
MNHRNFLTELKRRNVYKVGVAYAVVGWLLIQIATQVLPFLEIPNWAIRLIILLAALGFPVALVIAWAFELTPEGIKRTENADAARQGSRGGVWIVVVVVAAALSLALFFLGRYTAGLATPRQSEAATIFPEKSIAVLPLVNTSGDPANEYFSDGLSEELIAVLAKIPDLKVIGRSSSFLFKGKSDDSKMIGEKLGVANLIEGSVRKQGDRVRIVAELINAADGRSLWSETYDRELQDVFAIQAEIARSVAEQMKVKLLGETVRSDTTGSSENPAAHNAVLQSDFYFQQQTAESVRRAITFLQEAIRLDPNYALAYSKLAQAWRQYAVSYAIDDSTKAYDEARQAADEAVRLAPDLVEVRMTIGLLAMTPGLNFRAGEKEFRRVLQSSPNNAAAKNALCMSLLAQGRLTEAETTCQEALSLDPLLTTLWYNLGRIRVGIGHYKEAEEVLRKGLELQPGASRFHTYIATLDILQDRPAEALAEAQLENEGFWRDFAIALVQQALGERSVADAALKDFVARDSEGSAFQIAVLYAVRKDPDQMFQWLDTAYAAHDSGMVQLAITPFFYPYRDDPRFIALCQKLNVQLPAMSAKP